MGIKPFLLGSVCFGASALMTVFAEGQSSQDDRIDRLQRQVEQRRNSSNPGRSSCRNSSN